MMKRFALIIITYLSCISAFSQATDLVVDCQTPGWLSSKINYGDQLTVKNLKVTGYINSDDLHFIGELMDNYQLHGRIDLSDVGVVGNKMDPYTNFGITNNEYTIQYLALPKSLTEVSEVMHSYKGNLSSYLKVDTLEFSPNNINYVKASFFDNRQFESSIKHLILGEKIDSIPDDAFFDKGGVSSLKLPVGMKYIGKRAFMENYQSINDVNFNELSNLKYIGPGAFCGGYMATNELYQPDTLIIPNSLDNPFILFAFSCRDGQHIFIDRNINSISGSCIGSGGRETTGNTTAALNIHINNEIPPSIVAYKGNDSYTKFGNSTLYVPKGAKQAYLNSDWKYATIVEVAPRITFNISALGNGVVSYSNSTIRNQTKSFTLEEGSSATVIFNPDEGYRIASVKLNGIDVTEKVDNGQYTIDNISVNTTLDARFETALYDGAIFTAKTAEGVDMTFKVISETEKTCQVGTGEYLSVISNTYAGTITIPSSINGYSVTNIDSYAFSGCADLTSINIPNTIISIGRDAFHGCSGLTTVTIPNSVTKIGIFAFYECKGLTNITIPSSVTSMSALFPYCESLTQITVDANNPIYDSRENCNAIIETATNTLISGCQKAVVPQSVTAIGNNAFWGCYGLTSIVIPSSVSSIGYQVFYNCKDLENIIIPNSVTNIGIELFYQCSSLTSITIPKAVKTIGRGAFEGCSSITNITIPDSVISIGRTAFSRCSSMKKVVSKIKNPFKIENVFNGLPSDAELIVPYGKQSIYESTEGWNVFAKITEEAPQYYELKISAVGNGEVKYDGNIIRNQNQNEAIAEGSSITLFISPDKGYCIANVILNDTDVTSSVTNNKYTISNMTEDMTIAVAFEAIPHTLYITASGKGSVIYNSTAIRDSTQSFTVNEGTSATITFTPDAGYQIANVKLDDTDVTSSVANNKYTISNITANTTLTVTFEAITHTISVTSSGNGSAYYNNTTVRNKTEVFTVNEGTSATITFTPDAGYRITSVKVNGIDVTANVVSDTYTISNITANTTLAVTFEAIPPTTYTFSITASGNGSATYNSTSVRGKTQSFTVNEGESATITFAPDAGYRIASVKLDDTDVTSSVADNKYTISNITANTTLTVTFEAITHTISVTSSGNGSAYYNNTTVRNKTEVFTVNEGTSATITFTPDAGYRITSVKLNGTDVTASVANNMYTISSITANTTLTVTFEAIPPTTYTFSITATGNGTVTYNSTAVRGKTQAFTVNEGTSATITLVPDAGYHIKSVKLNNTDVTSNVANNQYTISNINSDNELEVEFEPITHTLTIKAVGNGSAIYNNVTIKGKSQAFTINEGTSATISFTPDAGYRIKSVKLNGTDIISSVTNDIYTINSISGDISLEVEFEVIPPTNYSMNIVVSGSGSVSYGDITIRNQSREFTVTEGNNVLLTMTPDNGYRVGSVKVNNTDVTGLVANGKLTISKISSNTNVEVTFEAIPPTTYNLTITATGNGFASYDDITIKDESKTFTVTEGDYVTVMFIPDNGYRVKSLKVNSVDVTAAIENHQYTFKITKNSTIDVDFEETPATTWTLSITATGNGSAIYNDATIRSKTVDFSVVEGASAVVKFIPDNGYRIKTVRLNVTDVTGSVANNQYTINRVMSNTSLEVEFMEDITGLTIDNINYTVVSYDDGTVYLSGGSYGTVLTVPASFTEKGKEWKVVGVDANALNNNVDLAAIIWNPEVVFNGSVTNPNLLLYVKSQAFASSDIQNVVVNNTAENIVLVDAVDGNNFYCPRAFTANRISYEHIYSMKSGYNTCQGWETLVLPFDVTQILRQGETELIPYDAWVMGSVQRPFWLYSLTELGWKSETLIAANTPYLIGMPNNEKYDPSYNVTGKIQFIGVNAQVKASENLTVGKKGQKKLVPNYLNQSKNSSIWVLNVNNDISTNTESSLTEGSVFVQNMRPVHPFEAYLTATGSESSKRVIAIFDEGETTGIINIPLQQDINNDAWYSLEGRKLQSEPTSKGVYIKNGKKIVVK